MAELESALLQIQANSESGPPLIPPRGLPPSPKRVVSVDVAMPHMQSQANTPRPPNHPPPLPSPSNQTPSRLLSQLPYSHQPPIHPPPLDQCNHTPPPPQNPAPRLTQHPRLLSHPPPQLPPHPPSQLPLLKSASSRGCKKQAITGKLLSSAINKSSLLPVNTIIKKYGDLVGKDGQIRSMALAPARDAFFGEEVMIRCTAQGWGDTPGLPHKELMEFKDKLRKLYPSYWNNAPAFEEQWSNCLSSISQACKRLRASQKSKNKRL